MRIATREKAKMRDRGLTRGEERRGEERGDFRDRHLGTVV
jgi:hypothetical protein